MFLSRFLFYLSLSANVAIGEPITGTPLTLPPNATLEDSFVDYHKKTGARVSEDISGAVCSALGRCFAVSDEARYLQEFTLDGPAIKPGNRLYLAKTKDTVKGEAKDFDIEGLASLGTTLIAV